MRILTVAKMVNPVYYIFGFLCIHRSLLKRFKENDYARRSLPQSGTC